MEPWHMIVLHTLEPRIVFIVAILVFIALDCLTGLTKAFATNSFSSTKVKTGLFHKAGILMVMVLALVIDTFMSFIPDLPFTSPVTGGVCMLIVVMEVMSCLENIVQINPNLKDSKLIQLLLPTTANSDTV